MNKYKTIKTFIYDHKISSLFIIFTLLFQFIIQLLLRFSEHFADWYVTHVYPIFINTVGRLFSPLPFSVSELLLLLLLLFIFGKIVRLLYKLYERFVRKKTDCRFHPFTGLLHIMVFLCILIIIYTLTCGINYHRHTFSSYLDFDITESTTEDLISLSNILIGEINKYSEELPVDENNLCINVHNADEIAVHAMNQLGGIYPSLSGYYPKPKPVIFSLFMSYGQITGIYSPFTVEANYNNHMPASDIPEAMCHELSHLRGFMREDEAEFIAYLACINSDNIVFQYSGTLTALSYTLNALYKEVGKEVYATYFNQLSHQVKTQLRYVNAYWSNYDGTIAKVQDKVNDTYLKANSQTDGVKSYGRMLDLLIAYYR